MCYNGVRIPHGKEQFWAWANMGIPGRFTKGHGSFGQRCGLLSNYFDLLFDKHTPYIMVSLTDSVEFF